MSERSSRSTYRTIQWVASALLLAAIAAFLWSRRAELAHALTLGPAVLAGISVGFLLVVPANAAALKAMAARFGARIPAGEALLITLTAGLLNYLPLKAGTIASGLVLRTRYRVPLTKFAALTGANYLVDLWVTLVFAGAVTLAAAGGTGAALLLIVVPTAALAGLLVWGRSRMAGTFFAGHTSPWARHLHSAVDGMRLLFADLPLIALLAAAQVVIVLGTAVQMFWAFRAVSAPIGFGQAVVVAAATIVAASVGVLPGAFGFVEAGAAGAAAAIGVAPALGLAAALIGRAVTMVWLALLGVPAVLHLSRLTGRSLLASADEDAVAEEPA